MIQELKTDNQHNTQISNLLKNVNPHAPFLLKWHQMEKQVEDILAKPQQNAIESMIQISETIKDYQALYYTNFRGDQRTLRIIYHNDLPRRIAFARQTITQNFLTGQQQDIYRKDISAEMVARSYTKRMLDLHNPKIFSPQNLSFKTIYKFMFEDFIKGISKPEGFIFLLNKTV